MVGWFSHGGMAGYDEFECTAPDRRPSRVREDSGGAKDLFSRPKRKPARTVSEDYGRRGRAQGYNHAARKCASGVPRSIDSHCRYRTAFVAQRALPPFSFVVLDSFSVRRSRFMVAENIASALAREIFALS